MPPKIYQSCLACEKPFHHEEDQIEDERRQLAEELALDADMTISED